MHSASYGNNANNQNLIGDIMANITFINASSTGENNQQTMINRAESSLENIIESLSFWFENGTDKESSAVADLELSDIEEIDQDEFDRFKSLIETYDEIGSFYEYGLGFDFVESDENSDGYYRYQLSWGGPSDEIRFYPDDTIEYCFFDWFVGIGLDVSDNDTMKECMQWFKECGSVDFESQDYYDVYKKESYDEDKEESEDEE